MMTARLRAVALMTTAPLILAGCSAGSLGSSGDEGGGTTVTFLVDSADTSIGPAEALAEAFNGSQEDYTVDVESRPAGTEGDNLIKTRLSTGSMDDVFSYNSGSLFQQIDPARNLTPLTDEGFMDRVDDSFKEVVTSGEDVYGVPAGTAFGGGVFYSKPLYEQLGLTVPTTWDEFIANSQAAEAAGATGVVQTYGETWTSQLLVLGDFHNVAAAEPDFAEQYTANEVKYATDAAAVKGFEHLQQVNELGLLNDDFASAEVTDGLVAVATGTGAHYPQLSAQLSNLSTVAPDDVDNVGFFAMPGDDAATYGLTAWFPNGLYVPQSTTGAELEGVKAFLDFVATPQGCDLYSENAAPTGPYLIEGCDLPEDVPAATTDVQAYFDEDQQSPALEFLSPVKGPNLENITVEVGSGIRPAADGAALYDQDVEKQAQQLGLDGW